jgi:hypothetical protein
MLVPRINLPAQIQLTRFPVRLVAGLRWNTLVFCPFDLNRVAQFTVADRRSRSQARRAENKLAGWRQPPDIIEWSRRPGGAIDSPRRGTDSAITARGLFSAKLSTT